MDDEQARTAFLALQDRMITALEKFAESSMATNKIAAEESLTKREMVAAFAMQGMASELPADYRMGPCNAAVAERAVILADCLLAELAKSQP